MGASADAYVIIGFEVDHSDFWTEQITKGTKPECSNGHPGKTGKYCQDCGELIEIQVESKTIPTPNFAKYCKDRNLDPEEVYVPDDPAYLEEAIDPSGFDGLELYCIDAYTDHDTDKETIALGVKVIASGSIMEGGSYGWTKTNKLDEKEIRVHMDKCRKIANDLGLDRPVHLSLVTHCSY
jgi:hypothetical protein